MKKDYGLLNARRLLKSTWNSAADCVLSGGPYTNKDRIQWPIPKQLAATLPIKELADTIYAPEFPHLDVFLPIEGIYHRCSIDTRNGELSLPGPPCTRKCCKAFGQ